MHPIDGAHSRKREGGGGREKRGSGCLFPAPYASKRLQCACKNREGRFFDQYGEKSLAQNLKKSKKSRLITDCFRGISGFAYTWPILLFLLVRFVPRSIARVKRERQHKKQQSSEAGAAALSELEAGTPDKALWAQALVAAKGDEKTARAEYIKLRMKNPVK
ncbi:MAG: hypothetical protein IJT50_16330 [Lentisphaeria bacterium]|nr:hypothetical protein [Lentisphaeria bacterium]